MKALKSPPPSNGYEALQQIESDAPDLVLLDIWMPGIDGIETLKEIKQKYPHIQVIMITGHGTIETAVRATKHGAFDFIEKPLSIDKVIVAINNALNFGGWKRRIAICAKRPLKSIPLPGTANHQDIKGNHRQGGSSDSWVLIKGENGTGRNWWHGPFTISAPTPERHRLP